ELEDLEQIRMAPDPCEGLGRSPNWCKSVLALPRGHVAGEVPHADPVRYRVLEQSTLRPVLGMVLIGIQHFHHLVPTAASTWVPQTLAASAQQDLQYALMQALHIVTEPDTVRLLEECNGPLHGLNVVHQLP